MTDERCDEGKSCDALTPNHDGQMGDGPAIFLFGDGVSVLCLSFRTPNDGMAIVDDAAEVLNDVTTVYSRITPVRNISSPFLFYFSLQNYGVVDWRVELLRWRRTIVDSAIHHHPVPELRTAGQATMKFSAAVASLTIIILLLLMDASL